MARDWPVMKYGAPPPTPEQIAERGEKMAKKLLEGVRRKEEGPAVPDDAKPDIEVLIEQLRKSIRDAEVIWGTEVSLSVKGANAIASLREKLAALQSEVEQAEVDAERSIVVPDEPLTERLRDVLLQQQHAVSHCNEETGPDGLCGCMQGFRDIVLAETAVVRENLKAIEAALDVANEQLQNADRAKMGHWEARKQAERERDEWQKAVYHGMGHCWPPKIGVLPSLVQEEITFLREQSTNAPGESIPSGRPPEAVDGPCGCEGSCPVCRLGEVDGHECDRCHAQFCPVCHGLFGIVPSDNVSPCSCVEEEKSDD